MGLHGPARRIEGHFIDDMLDLVKEKIGARSMKEVHLSTGIMAPMVSNIRNSRIIVPADLILKLHDITGVPVDVLREKLGHKKFVAHTHAQPSGAQQTAQNQGSN